MLQHVILQPTGQGRLPADVPVSFLRSYLGADELTQVQDHIAGGQVMLWAKPGGQKRWEAIEAGDIALFAYKRRYFAKATVALTLRNSHLATSLGQYFEDEPLEWVILYSGVSNIHLPAETLNRAVGYDPKFILRGSVLLDTERSGSVLALLGRLTREGGRPPLTFLVFPSPKDPAKPVSRHLLRDWWERGEAAADLKPERRRGWHSLRRKFATELKATPLKDLSELGGWKDPQTVLKCYQRAEPVTMRAALEQRGRLEA